MISLRHLGASAPSTIRLHDDHRFRALLSPEDWGRLPVSIWRRFSKRLLDGATVVYVGEIDRAELSRAGFWFAQAARLIGGPLPTSASLGVPMIVAVTEDAASGGQIWTRICGRPHGFPQVIHSAKRFAGPTGLEEYLGWGLSMSLRVCVADGALVFHSAGYTFAFAGRRWPLPSWLTPGNLTVTHSDLGGGAFRFALEIVHPRFGRLIRQSATFRESAP
ncbi:DUF4166 domain-containing protein [Bradyrhizobium sp. 83002]|uniref:DUF4166 domain-containing protein n=1 Tax=Bradyrhizobium aeschynomenes TaxID=2734909 RepID=UPI001553D086|nr:DUF4166 domain-containing protein [Bradyrhizobium aeschynomenes]NPU13018.1 DUF4166 domain-containing protein [Bradyrhizobium aeschynomenes]